MRWNIALSMSAMLLALAGPACAQDDETLDTRKAPGFMTGDFRITPKVTVYGAYDDNIYSCSRRR